MTLDSTRTGAIPDDARILNDGQREFMLDVRTQDLEVNFGPQHPATHGVMRVLMRTDGELVTGAQPHLGYLHRCAEKIGENVEWLQYLPYTDRYDYLAAMNNNLGYSAAVEALLGIPVPRRAEMLRVICAELNRVGSHLIAFGTYGLDIGAFTPFFYAFREREWMMALFEKICGARLTYSYIRIGGVFNDAPPGWLEEVARFCEVFGEKWQEYYDLLVLNQIFVKRTSNIGVISREMAFDFGLTGPMLRGSGVDWDLRRDLPYSIYGEIWREGAFQIPVARGEMGTLGDCWDRTWVRVMEMIESIKIVRWCLERIEEGPVLGDIPKTLRVPPGEAYVGIENPRGELGHYVVSDGGKVAVRVRVRGPSFTNLAVLEDVLPGSLVGDAIAIIGSTDIVVGETDR
ncbi:MAG TPA: NADH-quinone oxidoreductase subunit D [Planctomycetota bacterium]|nr:NADH-quinone oxidoreductase subunit D [Planctomycetota bacterium]